MLTFQKSCNRLVVVLVLISTGLLVSTALPLAKSQPPARSTDELATYRHVVKSVLPAVVSVETTIQPANAMESAGQRWRDDSRLPPEFRRFFEDFAMPFDWPDLPQHGLGSGFIIDGRGVVLTNYHVIKDATDVTVRLQDGRTFASTDIKSDPKTDLAVIRIKVDSALPYLEFGDSFTTEIGDRVLAIGAPFGLTGSVSAGIVSAKGRRLDNANFADFLQTDAAINPGNSGGPLVNLEGKVVGINTAIRTNSGGFQGVGLAISSEVARSIVDKLIKEGIVHRGYLGIQVQNLNPEIRARLGLAEKTGVLVSRTIAGAPAAKAGIQAGDVVVSVAGHPIHDPTELQRFVMDLPINQSVVVSVIRDGKALDLEVIITEQPGSSGRTDAQSFSRSQDAIRGTHISRLGIDLAEPSPDIIRRFGTSPANTGVLITNVTPGSVAARAGLRVGTLITKVDRTSVANVAEAQRAIDAVSPDQGTLLQVRWPDGAVGFVMISTVGNK